MARNQADIGSLSYTDVTLCNNDCGMGKIIRGGSGCVGFEPNGAEVVSWGQAYVGVQGGGQAPQQSDGGLGATFFDALDLIGSFLRFQLRARGDRVRIASVPGRPCRSAFRRAAESSGTQSAARSSFQQYTST